MFRSKPGGIQPEDIDLLQRVFDQLCKEQRLNPRSVDAELMGAALIVNYQTGAKDEATLLKVARKRPEHSP